MRPTAPPTPRHRVVRCVGAFASYALLVSPALVAQAPTSGPDVTIIELTDTTGYGSSGGFRGYAVGTTSCNVGNQPVNWCDAASGCGGILTEEQHPVIAQGLYRLKGGRFEQIGMSWLKHGFLSTNSPDAACQTGHPTCTNPPLNSAQLGVGCTDTYGSFLNGMTPLGLRSEVNATTGSFPFPYSQVTPGNVVDQHVRVNENDLVAASNPGALYWVEGQYIADNDAAAGNGFNNASYRRVSVQAAAPFNLTFVGATIREKTALRAWQVQDPKVELVNVDIPGAIVERFEVARRVTTPSSGIWHFEYAIRNLNSDRAGQFFAIDFPDGTTISNQGFKDTEHHSGEPYSTTDWTQDVNEPQAIVSWWSEEFGTNANANALRWATLFNYWFDADSPASSTHRLTFFKPGSPVFVDFKFPGIFADGFEFGDTANWSAAAP